MANSFVNISNEVSAQMLSNEPFVRETLTNGSFIKVYGPFAGLKFGATDIYQLYNSTEQIDQLRRMWRIEIK